MRLSVVLLPGSIGETARSLTSLARQRGATPLAEVVVTSDVAVAVGNRLELPVRLASRKDRRRSPWSRASVGDWVAVLQPGNMWPPGRLKLLQEYAAGSDLLYGDVTTSCAEDRFSDLVSIPDPEDLLTCIQEQDCVPAASLVVRCEFSRGCDTRRGTLSPAWEVHLLLSALERGARATRLVGEPVSVQEATPASNAEQLEFCVDRLRALRDRADSQRLAGAVLDVEVARSRTALGLLARIAPLRFREVRAFAGGRGYPALITVVPRGLGYLEPRLRKARPYVVRTLDDLARQPMHRCSSTSGLCARRPEVSIVIPCYNYADYVGRAIRSALSQSYPDVRVWVIDDGSTDGSWDQIQGYRERITAVRQGNMGISRTRNRALERVESEFVLFLDADDELEPYAVRELLGAFCDAGDDPLLGIAYGQQRSFGRLRHRTDFGEYDLTRLVNANYIPAEALLRSSTARLVRYDASLPAWEDWDFYLRAASLGFHAKRVDLPMSLYRLHERRSSRSDVLASRASQAALHEVLLRRNRDLVGRRRRLIAAAKRVALSAPSHLNDRPRRDPSSSSLLGRRSPC